MESVKRYVSLGNMAQRSIKHGGTWVNAADFDRVSVENLALQQRLTVQDQRVDELEALLRDLYNQCELTLHFDNRIEAALKPTAEAESHDAEDNEALQRRHDQERQEYFRDDQ